MIYLWMGGVIVGALAGFTAGFICRARTFQWCLTCGGSMGRTCIECRDRQRSTTGRARNERVVLPRQPNMRSSSR